jgi:RNA polymerase sigma-70 factor (ECF subfamily)
MHSPWLRMAAVLVLGVAVGRLSVRQTAAAKTKVAAAPVTVVANAMRRVKRLKTRETELDPAIPIRGGETAFSSDPVLRDRLQKAIDGLGEIYRTTLIMHDLEGYTHEEIAEILGVAEGTCKSRLSVARAQLRETLGDLRGEVET